MSTENRTFIFGKGRRRQTFGNVRIRYCEHCNKKTKQLKSADGRFTCRACLKETAAENNSVIAPKPNIEMTVPEAGPTPSFIRLGSFEVSPESEMEPGHWEERIVQMIYPGWLLLSLFSSRSRGPDPNLAVVFIAKKKAHGTPFLLEPVPNTAEDAPVYEAWIVQLRGGDYIGNEIGTNTPFADCACLFSLNQATRMVAYFRAPENYGFKCSTNRCRARSSFTASGNGYVDFDAGQNRRAGRMISPEAEAAFQRMMALPELQGVPQEERTLQFSVRIDLEKLEAERKGLRFWHPHILKYGVGPKADEYRRQAAQQFCRQFNLPPL